MGLEIALRNSGIRMLRANVGDKYVLEEMIKTGATLGGDSPDTLFSGMEKPQPGIGFNRPRVMEVVARTKRSLKDLADDLKVFPQTIQNIHVKEKVPFAQVPAIRVRFKRRKKNWMEMAGW